MLVGNTHLIAGSADAVPKLLALLGNEGFAIEGNPDLYIRAYQQFGIDEARELRERAALRPIVDRRVFVVAAPNLTSEAQNALLKTLEEPPAGSMFFIIVPSPHMLLPTLRSRAQRLEVSEANSDAVDVKKFLAAPPEARLKMLDPLLEKDADERRDLGAILAFLGALERRLQRNPDGLHAVYRARKYIGDKGALVKPLLEQVALLMPKA